MPTLEEVVDDEIKVVPTDCLQTYMYVYLLIWSVAILAITNSLPYVAVSTVA